MFCLLMQLSRYSPVASTWYGLTSRIRLLSPKIVYGSARLKRPYPQDPPHQHSTDPPAVHALHQHFDWMRAQYPFVFTDDVMRLLLDTAAYMAKSGRIGSRKLRAGAIEADWARAVATGAVTTERR